MSQAEDTNNQRGGLAADLGKDERYAGHLLKSAMGKETAGVEQAAKIDDDSGLNIRKRFRRRSAPPRSKPESDLGLFFIQ
jgi:hypothetical protein